LYHTGLTQAKGGGGLKWEREFKAIPVTGHGGPRSCEMSRLPHFLYSQLTDGSEADRITHWLLLPRRRLLMLICVRGSVDPMAIVQLDRKKPMTSMGTEPTTFWLEAYCYNQLCYRVPQTYYNFVKLILN
jgi:hypothetical protein